MANEFKIKKGLIVEGASGGTVVDVQGSQGQLFSVTDNLSGSIFAVSDISGVPILDVNSSGLSTFDGNVNLPDNKKILLGTGSDLEIYHDGSNSYIKDTGVGSLKTVTSGLQLLNATQHQFMILADGGATSWVKLYYGGDEKLATTNTGVSVTGNGIFTGNVGIGTTSPSQKLEVAGKLLVDNGNLGSVAGDTIYHAEITGARHHLDFKEVRTANGSDWMNTTYKLQMRVDSTNHQSIDFVSDANAKEHIDIYTGNQVFNTRFDANGNVGIGTTSPGSKLSIRKNGAQLSIQREDALGTEWKFYSWADGLNIFPAAAKDIFIGRDGASTNLQLHNGILRVLGTGDSYFTGNVGIGTTSPGAKLEVFGTGNTLRLDSAANGSKEILFRNVGTGTATIKTDGDLKLYVEDAGKNILFDTNGGEKMRITSGGELIINGTTSTYGVSQGYPLHVKGISSQGYVSICRGTQNSGSEGLIVGTDQSNAYLLSRDNIPLVLGNNNQSLVFIKPGGDVGIGTTSPSEKLEVNGNIKIKDALLSNQKNTDIDSAASEVVAQVSITDYTAAFFDFVIKKGTNVRSGTVYACHDGDTTPLVEFTETSTQDLGDTSDVVLSVDISGTNMRLLATVASDDWSVKSLIRAI
jgi:hypothetical protein